MPSLGADMDSGTLVEWLVHEGDTVHRGDAMAVVDTDKSAIEVESFDEGVVETFLVAPGTRVAVGTPLARLTPLGASVPAPRAHRAPGVRREQGASPYSRRLARELGVDLARVTGTGPGGTVRADDVLAARERTTEEVPPGPAPAAPPEPTPVARPAAPHDTRATIAALMSRAKREIPHYYVASTVDLHELTEWLHRTNRERGVSERIVPAAAILKATALAARRHPELNGFWVLDEFHQADDVHLGVAVRVRDGALVAPAIHHTADLSLPDLMAALRDLVKRARAGRLKRAELADPTLTVTDLGDQGVEEVIGVIYPPQVALLGVGRITEHPWAVDGMLAVRPTVRLTLSGDHRATDGAAGARFLNTIEQLLQHPEEL